MVLQYAYLSEVFPNFSSSDTVSEVEEEIQIHETDIPPEYSTSMDKILDLHHGEKLRICDGNLEIDTRPFQYFSRKYTGDSRWKILEKILECENSSVRDFYLDILRSSTYSKDKKWVEASKKKNGKY